MPTGVWGDRELVAALREMADAISVTDVDQAAIEAMKPMTDDAVQNARASRNFVGKHSSFFPQPKSPRKGGHLDQGIKVRRQKGNRFQRSYRLGASRRAVRIAHLVEFGTAPHFQPKFKGGWHHPGARRSPFLGPAYDAHKGAVINRMGQALWVRLRNRALSLRKGPRRRP